jgi:hypothetical protein
MGSASEYYLIKLIDPFGNFPASLRRIAPEHRGGVIRRRRRPRFPRSRTIAFALDHRAPKEICIHRGPHAGGVGEREVVEFLFIEAVLEQFVCFRLSVLRPVAGLGLASFLGPIFVLRDLRH